MKYKKLILVVIITCIFLFRPFKASGWDLAVCGSYSATGMMCYDLKGGTYDCEVLESDSYGRILFSYSAENHLTESRETVLVIAQKIGAKEVCYYEDVSRVYAEGADVEALKTANDWERPLDEEKFTRRPNEVSADGFIMIDSDLDYLNHTYKEAVCCKVVGGIGRSQLDMGILDADGLGNELYCAWVTKDEAVEKYLVYINPDYEGFAMKITDAENLLADIAAFKQENGWPYNHES